MYKPKRFLLYIRQENIYCEKIWINKMTTFKKVEKYEFYIVEHYVYL